MIRSKTVDKPMIINLFIESACRVCSMSHGGFSALSLGPRQGPSFFGGEKKEAKNAFAPGKIARRGRLCPNGKMFAQNSVKLAAAQTVTLFCRLRRPLTACFEVYHAPRDTDAGARQPVLWCWSQAEPLFQRPVFNIPVLRDGGKRHLDFLPPRRWTSFPPTGADAPEPQTSRF